VSFSVFVEQSGYFCEPILNFRTIYRNPAIKYYKMNFTPEQSIEKSFGTQDTKSSVGGL
jgi:hypothetical protein